MAPRAKCRSSVATMPRPAPRQQLIRNATVIGVLGLGSMAAAITWIAMPPTIVDLSVDHGSATTIQTRDEPPAIPPGVALWRPFTDAPPLALVPPPPPPTFRLVSLSQRHGAWTALIDSGGSTGMERAQAGNIINGWLVESIDARGVDLSAGSQRHRLQFAP